MDDKYLTIIIVVLLLVVGWAPTEDAKTKQIKATVELAKINWCKPQELQGKE